MGNVLVADGAQNDVWNKAGKQHDGRSGQDRGVHDVVLPVDMEQR